MSKYDEEYIQEAVQEARAASNRGDYGIGAVIVLNGEIISRAGNEVISRGLKPWAHAEILALRNIEGSSVDTPDSYRQMTVYTTLEPCPQCWGTLLVRGVHKIVIGAEDVLARSNYNSVPPIFKVNIPQIEFLEGALTEECSRLFLETKNELDQKLGL